MTVYGVNVDRLKRPESRAYVRWVTHILETEGVDGFGEFREGRGIVAARDRFLAWRETAAGQEAEPSADQRPFDRTLLVPIAVPGSGK